MKKILFSTLLCLFSTYNAKSQKLDSSFDNDGKVITVLNNLDYNNNANAVAIQSDNKIVVAGSVNNGTGSDFVLVRYNHDGSLDYSFGINGIAQASVGTIYEVANSLVIQPNGKIILAGFVEQPSYASYDFALTRFNTDGSLDNSFGNSGVIITSIGQYQDVAYSVTLQNDDKILAAGFSNNGTSKDFTIVRYNSDGSLDNSFNSNGKVVTEISAGEDVANSILIQKDNKIILSGYGDINSNYGVILVRYNSDGSLDNSFGLNGKVVTLFNDTYSFSYSSALQSDNKIIVVGRTFTGTNDDFLIMRYNSDGSLDNTFDSDGIVTTEVGGGDAALDVNILSNGKILVTGGSSDNFSMALYNTDGSLYKSFGVNGTDTTDFGKYDISRGSTLQEDNKIVMAGVTTDGFKQDFAISRYILDFEETNEPEVNDKLMVIPNLFTPNHDFKNDSFTIANLMPDTKIEIYNRWGTLVYKSTNYKNDFTGENESDQIFYYCIVNDKFDQKWTGWVQKLSK